MEIPIETRVALIEREYKELVDKHQAICNRVTMIESERTNQAVLNQSIFDQLKTLQTLLETKKKEFNLWIPIGLMMVFDIVIQIILPKL